MKRRWEVGGIMTVAAYVSLATLTPLGAQGHTQWRPFKFVLETPGQLDRSIVDDPAAIELREIARTWTERAIAPDVDPDALVEAYANGDDVTITRLLGLSRQEVADTAGRLVRLSGELAIRYPQVAGAVLAGARLGPGEVVARLQHGFRGVRERAAELRRAKWEMMHPLSPAGVEPASGLAHGPWVPDPALGELWGELEPRITPCRSVPAVPAQAGSGGGGGGGGSWGDDPPEGCDEPAYMAALVGCALVGPYGYWLCAYVVYCSLCDGEARDALCDGTIAPYAWPSAPPAARYD